MKRLKTLASILIVSMAGYALAYDLMPLQGINGMCGYQNVSGVMVIKPKYDQARQFYEGLAAVCRDGKWGYINLQGRIVAKLIYQACENFNNGYAIVKRDGKWGAINTSGQEVVPCQFDTPADLQNLIVITKDDKKTVKKASD